MNQDIIIQNYTPKKENPGSSEGQGSGRQQRHQPVWEEKFLESLRMHGVITAACLDAGIERDTAYKARERDSDFAERWQDALDQACDLLEFHAKKRALESSDTLMIFLLKAHRPEKYRDRVEVNLKVKPSKPLDQMTNAELEQYERDLQG
jgi:hypothetical protein